VKKVTITDVAKKAGVSVKTVSRVINSEPNVRPALQKLVRNAVEELGFKRNQLARGLRSQHSFILTLIYSNPNPAYILELQNGALNQAISEGYNLQLYPIDHTSENIIDEIKSLITHSSPDGLILTHPLCDNKKLIEMLDEKKIPFARISPFGKEHPSPCVFSDDEEAAYQMTKYLISLGHKDIGFIKGHPDFGATHKRYNGFVRACKEYSIAIDPTLVKQGFFTYESGESCARELLSQAKKASAIFASNDYMAAAVLKVATQMKINVPTELSLVGYDDSPVAHQIWPSLTTVKQPIKQLGTNIVKKLILHIHNKDFSEIDRQLDCQIIHRASSTINSH